MKLGRRRTNVFLLVVSLVLVFFVVESFLASSDGISKKKIILKYGTRELLFAHDKHLIYKGIPSKNGNNSKGYWDYEYSYAKDQGVYRVVVIGDSVAHGQFVRLEEGFSKLLEEELNDVRKAKKFEVIKLTQTGYSTSQELWLLKHEAFRYSPDAIIWSYCLNDPADPAFHDVNGELGRYFYVPSVHLFNLIKKTYFNLSERKSIRDQKCNSDCFDSFLHCVYWDQVRKDIREIARITRSHKIPVFFVIHPTFFQNKEFSEYPLTELHAKLVALASSNGLIPIDLLDCYRRYVSKDIRNTSVSWFDCWHLSARGHVAVAAYLYRFILPYLNE